MEVEGYSDFRLEAQFQILSLLKDCRRFFAEQTGTSVTDSLLMFIKWLAEKHGFNYFGNFYQHYCQPGMSVAGSLVARRTY